MKVSGVFFANLFLNLYKYNNYEVYNYAQYAVASMVGYGNHYPELLYNDFSTFRCARTIHGSYTGSD